MNRFVAGNRKFFYLNWKSITNDEIILDIIENGLKIDFKKRPINICVPKIYHSTKERQIINSEFQKLLDKGVIVQCDCTILCSYCTTLSLQFSQERRKMAPLELF